MGAPMGEWAEAGAMKKILESWLAFQSLYLDELALTQMQPSSFRGRELRDLWQLRVRRSILCPRESMRIGDNDLFSRSVVTGRNLRSDGIHS
jgi:hypothetical protein